MSENVWPAPGPQPDRPVRQEIVGRRRFGGLRLLLIVLVVLGVLAQSVGTWTDYLWFDSVGYRRVWTTRVSTELGLFVVGALIVGGALLSSLVIAHRARPLLVPMTPGELALQQYRQVIEPLRRVLTSSAVLIFGLMGGAAAAAQWKSLLLLLNRQPFGVTDPQFGIDVGFYVFTLPFLLFVVGFLTMTMVLALVGAGVAHYIYGGLQLPRRGPSSTTAIIHLSVIGALLAILRGLSYWLDRYAQTARETDLLTGVDYTAANAVLPTKAILAVAAFMCAALFLSAIWTRSWRLPVLATVLLVVLSVLVGSIYPAAIQALRVTPSAKTLQAPYLANNIAATRTAFGVDDVTVIPYDAEQSSTRQLRTDAADMPSIRLMDPNVISPSFRQREARQQYYAFPQTLDVDRYPTAASARSSDTAVAAGRSTGDVVVAVRELSLDGIPDANESWLKAHTVYTHGYGLVAAHGNQRTSNGDPVFIPSGKDGPLGDFEPRIYFGEQSPDYSVVGAPAGAAPGEFDAPDDKGLGGQRQNTYAGIGGVPIGSFPRRVAYAVKYREPMMLLSNAVNSQSRILDHRSPKERVERVAPWLTLDGNTYPSVVDGRVQWIVDGYTTTARYPNSRLVDMQQVTSDSTTAASRQVQSSLGGRVNYVRNSVKATVDAYDGTVKLYAWDTEDPILKAWSAAFDGTVLPLSDIDGGLMRHLRYPQDLFKAQRQILSRYHVTDPGSFFDETDFWEVPKDPTDNSNAQPPYYQSLAMPGQKTSQFSLSSLFIPYGGNSNLLRGYLAADAEPGGRDGVKGEGYGRLRLLELPRQSNVKAPGQVQQEIETSSVRSEDASQPFALTQYIKNGEDRLVRGNLLTLPVGGGLLYVEPLYLRASESSGSFPQNKQVVAVFGDKLAWAETLDAALAGLTGQHTEPAEPTKPPAGGGGGTGSAALAKALADAQAAYAEGQEALTKGDFTAYDAAQKKLKAAIDRAVRAAPQGGSVDLSP